jgi:hypothetical protein
VIIHVEYMDHSSAHWHVGAEHEFKTWKINPQQRCLIIGSGLPRVQVPLDNVRAFTLEEEKTHEHGGN